MPSAILECPIDRCPVEPCAITPTPQAKAPIIPVGSFINSPGGSYIYEVMSEPIERKYLDFKGLFDKPLQTKCLTEEIDSIEDLQLGFVIRSFFSAYRVGNVYKAPSVGRLFWVWLAAMLGKDAPHWYLSVSSPLSPYWLMLHSDESSPEHHGKNYYRSYKVRIWFEGANGWKHGITKTATIRWVPVIINFDAVAA
jgi:hypothetical protein